MPSAERISRFVEAVRASGLLPATDMDVLAAAARDPDADPELLARSLVKRGLLTPYQIRRLWQGRADDLFLNQYVLLDKLGEGGMGEVFRARHQRLGRDVALKVMRREKLDNPEAVRRFRREIRAAATLAHENVVAAFDADQAGDRHFFAMEFVDGTTLDRYVRERGRLPVGEACDYVRQTALGLAHAHAKGLIHRDIKPSNLLLSKDGVIKISDLGLVLVDDPGGLGGSRITKEGLTVGTPDFLAPEQGRNPRGADGRADIYALGCTFYYLLMGEVPFPGGTPTEKMLRHVREPVPEAKRDDLPATVQAVLAKMTSKNPEDRYQSPAEVADALAPFAQPKGVSATPPPMPIIEGPLTDDELPTSDGGATEIDSRFRLSESSQRAPAAHGKGCLPIVLAGLALAAWWRWR
jgi:eukaryotic-like serine/threonine-protein kinase